MKNCYYLLHIISDSVFINKGLKNFSETGIITNKTLLISFKKEIKHLDAFPDIWIKNKLDFLNLKKIISLYKSSAIILHSLNIFTTLILLLAPRNKKILWIGWGFDYYNRMAERGYTLYGPMTDQILHAKYTTSKIQILLKLKKSIIDWLFRHAINRIDFFSPVLSEDYDLFKQYFPTSKMVYMPWNYGVSDLKARSISERTITLGSNILIGNSASYTNNHLEAFEILQHIDLGDRKIIVPLSYGDSYYRDRIIQIGKEMFGEKFIPITEFLPYDEYVEILKTCSFCIMNHYRQQATGNISLMLCIGAKVFLSERNPYYQSCLKQCRKVYSIENLKINIDEFFYPISEADRLHNISFAQTSDLQNVIFGETVDIINVLLDN